MAVASAALALRLDKPQTTVPLVDALLGDESARLDKHRLLEVTGHRSRTTGMVQQALLPPTTESKGPWWLGRSRTKVGGIVGRRAVQVSFDAPSEIERAQARLHTMLGAHYADQLPA